MCRQQQTDSAWGPIMHIAIILCVFVAALILAFCLRIVLEISKARSDDPHVWERDIRTFERAARKHPPPSNATLFVGSSSIRFWRSLKDDMHPIPVIQRGFGGSRLAALDFYAERLVENNPRVIVVFCGTNDITPKYSKEPQQLLESFRSFVTKVRAKLPDVPIYYIAITPSPSRWKVWPIAQQVNQLIRDYCEHETHLHFFDTTAVWLTDDGLPDPANYLWIDRLHPNKRGYANWTRLIRPILLEYYPEYAKQDKSGYQKIGAHD